MTCILNVLVRHHNYVTCMMLSSGWGISCLAETPLKDDKLPVWADERNMFSYFQMESKLSKNAYSQNCEIQSQRYL